MTKHKKKQKTTKHKKKHKKKQKNKEKRGKPPFFLYAIIKNLKRGVLSQRASALLPCLVVLFALLPFTVPSGPTSLP